VFCIGVGFAFNAPAWTSIVPQVVSDEELPSAATLSGLQFNISGISEARRASAFLFESLKLRAAPIPEY
jgi:hypothetical protein